MRKLSVLTKLVAWVLAVGILMHYGIVANAANGSEDKAEIYTVLARSNMHATPSTEGRWVTTVPDGAFVVGLGLENDFYHVRYGEYEGYVYRGCVSVKEEATYQDYINQFPELNINNGNAEEQVGTAVTEKPPIASNGFNEAVWQNKMQKNEQQRKPEPEREQEKMEIVDKQREVKELNAADGTTTQESLEMIASDFNNGVADIETTAFADVNVRMLPTSESQQIGTLAKGEKLQVLDEGDNGYIHIKYSGGSGYVYCRSIDYDGGASVVNISNQTAPIEDTVLIKQEKIISNSYVDKKIVAGRTIAGGGDNSNSMQQNGASDITTFAVDASKSYAMSTAVSMRSMPDKGSEKLTTIPMGADVVLLGQSSTDYTLVQYNGLTGYVLESYVVDAGELAVAGEGSVLFTLTGYCSCQKCCGSYSPEVTGCEAHTATGTVPTPNRTLAVDPAVIPYGTQVVIEGMGTYVAEDCGGAIKGNKIDVYFNTHDEAVQFGVQRRYVSFVQ